MKKTLITYAFIFCISLGKLFAQPDPAYIAIAQLNLNHYASLPVDSFLHVIPQSYNYIQLYGVLNNDKVGGLGIRYPSGMTIQIKPMTYNFMNPIDSNGVWNLVLFKRETAYYIVVGHPDFPTISGKMTAVAARNQ